MKYASPQPCAFWDPPAERDRSSDQRCHASANGTSQYRGAPSITLGSDFLQKHASPSHALLPRAFRHQQNRPKNLSRTRVPFGKTCCMATCIKGKDIPLLVSALCTSPGCCRSLRKPYWLVKRFAGVLWSLFPLSLELLLSCWWSSRACHGFLVTGVQPALETKSQLSNLVNASGCHTGQGKLLQADSQDLCKARDGPDHFLQLGDLSGFQHQIYTASKLAQHLFNAVCCSAAYVQQ